MAICGFADNLTEDFFYSGIVPRTAGWRLVFCWTEDGPDQVSLVDYHR